jgi:Flp pilus assembly protein TadB
MKAKARALANGKGRMKLIDFVIVVSRYAPEVRIKSKMLGALAKLGLGVPEGRYVGAALLLSVPIALAGGALAIFFGAFGDGIVFGLLGFALAFGFILVLPSLELKARTADFEARLPLFLRTLGMLLGMRMPFERALAMAAQDEPEFGPVLDDISRGATVQKALGRLAVSHDSFAIKRALSQLLTAYEVGGSGQDIGRIGDEMLSAQRHSLREYASKSAIFGLVFIVSAAVLPTFFLVYAVLGDFTLGARPLDRLGMAIAMLALFPLISFLVLLVARSVLPRSGLEDARGQGYLALLLPAAMLVLSFLALPEALAPFGVAAGFLAAGYLLYTKYGEEKRVEELEGRLPDALFAVSGLPKSASMEDVFCMMGRAGYGPLSDEAEKSGKQLSSNLGAGLVLDDLASRNRSPMLRRACAMLKHVFATNSFSQLNRLAEDMLRFTEVRRERAGLLAMQKYTLLLGGLLVPLILRITLGLLGSMAEFLAQGGDAADNVGFARALIPAYLVIYAALSSNYIANMDSRRSQSAGYFLAIAGAGLAAFFFINV